MEVTRNLKQKKSSRGGKLVECARGRSCSVARLGLGPLPLPGTPLVPCAVVFHAQKPQGSR